MVLYKRKPISYAAPPGKLDDNTQIWAMRGSDEIFTSYEAYLERYDFYSQRHFTDAVNGKTGMTFFEALESENTSQGDIERIFPDALRAPILRKVQFSEIARMDDLVNFVYEEFRSDFFPGEELGATLDDGEQIECVVREKANFPELRNPDGSIQRPGFARYFVAIKDSSDEQALLDGDHLKRARNIFTKMNVRCYLKNCLWREPWIGAPWLVKEPLAQHYRLPMTIPYHLTQEAKVAQVRAQQAQKDSPAIKGKKGGRASKAFSVDQLIQQEVDQQIKQEVAKQEPPKYPIEDLDLEPAVNGSKRPQLKFLAPLNDADPSESGLTMDSMGPLLEIWNAVNVHWDIFEVDAFNFDDFVDAMKLSTPNITCELFDEVHCGVLTSLVDKDGEVLVRLPEFGGEIEEDDEEEVSAPPTPIELPSRSRRSRLSQVQTAEPVDDKPRKTHQAVEMLEEQGWVDRLKARDLADGGWQIIMVGLLYQMSLDPLFTARCEPILQHLAPVDLSATQNTARNQYLTLDINLRIRALHILVMLSMTSQTIRRHLEDRSEEMTLIRKQKTEMQRLRKELLKDLQRLEWDRAESNPDAFLEDEDTKKEVDTPVMTNGHGADESLSTLNGVGSDEDEDDEDAPRPLRRSNNARKRKRDEENAKREAERLARLSAQKESNDKLKKYKKILKDIEKMKDKIIDCEKSVEGFDDRLREMNATRMRSLGRDRFWNRYWWFERVGLPINGTREPAKKKVKVEPDDNAGYANGRLWIQGPVPMEREGFIDMPQADAKQYASRHGMTVAERKLAEEGADSISSASQWGFYDTSDDLDTLIGWLDDRGRREKDLRKELVAWREDIVTQMDVLQSHLHPETDTASAEHDESADELGPRTRVSTRNKTYLDSEDVEKHWRCLRWRNTRAKTKTGRHCNGTAVTTTAAGRGRKGPAAAAAAKPAKRSGKGVAVPVAPAQRGGRGAARDAAEKIKEVAGRERRGERESSGTRRSLRSGR
ncbi:hypothetical protein K461DRAFT_40377 [Myriangium duriaei CBS 260.36]|uniref:WAC domain-containing protein n=1 Tax=Myriangium duriaei CBS 260.36 TaxID=1168546 RepID=A0A9P4IX72_9PEZI|nr:hypothetical protein K461DRAFT_40377 [Myriangium duriaei CBS 260.36]